MNMYFWIKQQMQPDTAVVPSVRLELSAAAKFLQLQLHHIRVQYIFTYGKCKYETNNLKHSMYEDHSIKK